MSKRGFVAGVLMAGAIATGGVTMASPAWASPSGAPAGSSATEVAPAACSLNPSAPGWNPATGKLGGYGSRTGCSNTVTYFWVRVYKVISWWPDSEKAVRGATYWRNGGFTATGNCEGRGQHYTHVSTATGASGDSRESARRTIC